MSELPALEVHPDGDQTDLPTRETSRAHRRKGWNLLAIVAVVLAVVGSPLAMPFGYIAVGQIRRADQRGIGMAWTAVGLGWLWTVVFLVLAVALATIWSNNPVWP